jgi:hypothetical protein
LLTGVGFAFRFGLSLGMGMGMGMVVHDALRNASSSLCSVDCADS